ncbi:MAG: alpha/beta hydrolase [Prosthecochloris sp.]|uniref:Alpha/beta hydrolase fold n=1 Tax=Chlorobium phaeobacteroides (strain BS1) TaxID=331678 RepID=B3EKM7_CHLPB|nr:alpha/beta hydrolase [Prosthecochloris sp.]
MIAAKGSGAESDEYENSLIEKSCFIELNGVVHHYHDSGLTDARETVVLVHGWDCWWMWWHHIIRFLNDRGIRTIAYDLKGHGWSDEDPGNDYSIDSFAGELGELVRALGLKKIHIAAFSFGPFIALQYAIECPECVRSMVFFNFGYLENNRIVEKIAPATINFTFNNLLRKVGWWLPAYVFARLVLSRNTVLFHDVLIGFESLSLCAPQAIEQSTSQITSMEVTRKIVDLVEELEVPVLFVAGEGDGIMTAENTEKLSGHCKKGIFVNVPQCGHLITLELPETAAELIYEHLMHNVVS